MFLNLVCLLGRTTVLAIIHTPGIRNFVSYEFKESYHNNTEARATRMCKDLGVKPTPFKKYHEN